jgi:hypothetical protein
MADNADLARVGRFAAGCAEGMPRAVQGSSSIGQLLGHRRQDGGAPSGPQALIRVPAFAMPRDH